VSARHAALIGLVAAVWGSSYLLIKYALRDFSAAEVVFGRVAVGALALVAVVAIQRDAGREVVAELRERPARAFGLGAVFVALPFLLIALGELVVPSGLTAILIAPVPLFVAALAPLADHSERIDGRQWLGLGIGMAGIALIVGVESIGTVGQLLGALAILGAPLCYAIGSFVVKRSYLGISAIATSTLATLAAAVLTLPPALATIHGSTPGLRAIIAIVVLGVLNTALAFVLYYRLIADLGAGRAALVTYIAPVFALAYGAIFLGEAITPAAVIGFCLVVAGVWLASRVAAREPVEAPTRP